MFYKKTNSFKLNNSILPKNIKYNRNRQKSTIDPTKKYNRPDKKVQYTRQKSTIAPLNHLNIRHSESC